MLKMALFRQIKETNVNPGKTQIVVLLFMHNLVEHSKTKNKKVNTNTN